MKENNGFETLIRIETDGFERITRSIENKNSVLFCSQQDVHFIFGEDRLGKFIYLIHSKNCGHTKFYYADDVLRFFNDKYYEVINHKVGRVDYLKSLGISDTAIASIKRTTLKLMSEFVYGQNRGLAVVGQRKCIFVHEFALRELLEKQAKED